MSEATQWPSVAQPPPGPTRKLRLVVSPSVLAGAPSTTEEGISGEALFQSGQPATLARRCLERGTE